MISLRSAAVAAVGAAVLLAPTPALADGYTQVDAVRDVTRVTFDLESDGGRSTAVPGETATDIRRVRFDLGERKLVVVATMRSISPRVRAFAVVRTPATTYYLQTTPRGRVLVETDRNGSDHGSSSSAGAGAAERARCEGATATTKRSTRSYRLVVPVSCFGSPRAARLGFAVAQYRETSDRLVVDIDDAARTGYPNPQAEIKLGRKIRRG